jgi:acetyltransferase-like isoleucine patch superfamily enzyme
LGQLRANIKWSLLNHLRFWREKRRLGFLGDKVFIEKNVALMRNPGNISINNYVVIKEGAKICACNKDAFVSIGMNTTVGYHTYMFASAGISIGDDCLIAPFVYIVDSDHGIDKAKKINQQGNISEKITIGNDVWIGTGAKILKGVTIADGAVIAAGSLVKSDVGPYEIFGGIPAKKISERQ